MPYPVAQPLGGSAARLGVAVDPLRSATLEHERRRRVRRADPRADRQVVTRAAPASHADRPVGVVAAHVHGVDAEQTDPPRARSPRTRRPGNAAYNQRRHPPQRRLFSARRSTSARASVFEMAVASNSVKFSRRDSVSARSDPASGDVATMTAPEPSVDHDRSADRGAASHAARVGPDCSGGVGVLDAGGPLCSQHLRGDVLPAEGQAGANREGGFGVAPPGDHGDRRVGLVSDHPHVFDAQESCQLLGDRREDL